MFKHCLNVPESNTYYAPPPFGELIRLLVNMLVIAWMVRFFVCLLHGRMDDCLSGQIINVSIFVIIGWFD